MPKFKGNKGVQWVGKVPTDPSQKKERLCLGGCGSMFLSNGPGHRICPVCSTKTSPNKDADSYPYDGTCARHQSRGGGSFL